MKFSVKNIFKNKTKKIDLNSYNNTCDGDCSGTEEYRKKSVFWSDEIIPSKIDENIIKVIYQKHLLETDIESFLATNDHSKQIDCLNHYDIYENLNFPGPFYTGESDTCGTGISEAPENVVCNNDGQEFVMIQPRSTIEMIQVLNAGETECFSAYSCFGNEVWTPDLVRGWWSQKGKLIDYMKSPESDRSNINQNRRYIKYLETYAEQDLRKYLHFLECGVYPLDENVDLPSLKQ